MIPVLDVSPLRGGDAAAFERLAQDFLTAYGQIGFGAIVGHGVDPALIADVFEASRRFHASPRDDKMKIALGRNHRGFIPIDTSTDRTSTLADVKTPNQSESFIMLREDAPGAQTGVYLAGANQWPDGLPGFREVVEAYNKALCTLGMDLVRLAARSVGAAADTFDEAFATPTTWLRLLHYPEQPEETDAFGSAPHCDFGAVTILAQDDAGGLQVMRPDGGWIDVPPMPDAFVVNVGDMLSRWTNGRLKSTPHRVINRSSKARYSVPFFFDPHVSTVIQPLDCCVPQGAKPSFAPLLFGDFLHDQLTRTYDAHAGASD